MSQVTTYAEAQAFLDNDNKHGRTVSRKKIANNTYVERGVYTTGRGDQIHAGEIGVVLHETAIVIYGPGYVRLNTGGWYTITTRERIERFTPASIAITSRDSRWYLHYAATSGRWSGHAIPFEDGMKLIHSLESWVPIELPRDVRDRIERDDEHNAMVRRLVKDWLKAYEALTLAEVACPLCHWTDEPTMTGPYCSARSTIPNLGDRMEDQQHLLDHLLDRTVNQSMVLHAVREASPSMEVAERRWEYDIRLGEHLGRFLLTRLLRGATTIKGGRRPVVTTPAA